MKRITNRDHMGLVARLPCCVCGINGVQVHHLIGRNLSGTAQRTGDWYTIPLCMNHHTGRDGIHNGWRSWEHLHGSQIRHHEQTLDLIYGKLARQLADDEPF